MTEQEFHTRRRMWAVVDGDILVAEAGDPRSHYEWLSSWRDSREVTAQWESITRGYVLDGRLVAYVGEEFARPTNRREVVQALDELEKVCGMIHTVGLGARPDTRIPWPPRVEAAADVFRQFVAEKGG